MQNSFIYKTAFKFKKAAFLFFILSTCFFAKGQQQYPVKVNAYSSSSSNVITDYKKNINFRVTLTQTDPLAQPLTAVLKLTLRQGTSTFVNSTGIDVTLLGGAVYQLSDQELSTLIGDLAPQNIQLVAGILEWEFSVTEKFTGRQISNSKLDIKQFMVIMNEPPLLNMPANNFEVDLSLGQNIQFNWTPRNISVIPSVPIKYRFKLWKYNPALGSPYQAALSNSLPLVIAGSDALTQPSFVYTIADMKLAEGEEYIWQVEAYEIIEGQERSLRFNNGGKSDVYYFKIKESCDQPKILAPRVEPDPIAPNEQLIVLDWDKGLNNTEYVVKYRPQGSVQSWVYQNVIEPNNQLELDKTEIQKGITYEYSVGVKCKNWLAAQYGGEFKLQNATCEAPTPIFVDQETNNIKLRWDAPASTPSNYRVSFYLEGDVASKQIFTITEKEYLLPKITTGAYIVQVDALCSATDEALGKPLKVNFDEDGFAGDCELPVPFYMLTDPKVNGEVRLYWTPSQIAQSYDVTYYKAAASPSTATTVHALTAEYLANNIAPNTLYTYSIKQNCTATKTVTSPLGGFKVDLNDSDITPIPGTANCFPPTDLDAQIKSEDKARFEWNKIKNADEYQLVYYTKPLPPGVETLFKTTAQHATIQPLDPVGVYYYKVRARCGADFSIYSVEGSIDMSTIGSSDCPKVQNLIVSDSSFNELQLTWLKEANSGHTGYNIMYKTADKLWKDAYSLDLPDIAFLDVNKFVAPNYVYTIDKLRQGTRHDFKIEASCANGKKSRFSDEVSGTTLSRPSECVDPNACDKSSTAALAPAPTVESVILMAKYSLKISEISSSSKCASGITCYQGKAMAKMNILGKADAVMMEVTFDSLFVNNKNCVVFGNTSTEVILNPLSDELKASISGLVNKIEELNNKLGDAVDFANKALDIADQINSTLGDMFNGDMNAKMEAKYKGKNTVELFNALKDVTTTLTALDLQNPANALKAAELAYEVGWLAKKLGVTANQEYLGLAALENRNIEFSISNSQKDYFDAFKTTGKFPKLYEQPALPDSAGTYKYYVPYVAITPSTSGAVAIRKVTATVTVPGTFDKTKLKFVSNSSVGQLISANTGVGEKTLTYTGDGKVVEVDVPSNADQVYAIYDGLRIGKLNVVETPEITKTLVVVPRGTSNSEKVNASDLQTELNKIYDIPNVTFTVELAAQAFTDKTWDLENDGLNVADHKFMSRTSTEMDAIETKYFAQAGVTAKDPNKYYLFMVETIVSAADEDEAAHDLDGYMPRNKKVGFISSNSEETIAHELGHGMFKLAHTWQLDPDQPQKSTDNLMDYKNGKKLLGAQWKQIQDPTFDIYGLDKIEDGAIFKDYVGSAALIYGDYILKNGRVIRGFVANDTDKYFAVGSIDRTFKYTMNGVWLYEKNDLDVLPKFIPFEELETSNEVIITLQESAELVRVVEAVDDKCFYRRQNINWVSNTDEGFRLLIEKDLKYNRWVYGLYFNAQKKPNCRETFAKIVGGDRNESKCLVPASLESYSEDLKSLITKNESVENISSAINATCRLAIQELSYEDFIFLFKKIASSKGIVENSEISILKLMKCLSIDRYEDFLDELSKENFKLFNNLIVEMDDASIFPWDGDHYTNFIGTLVKMYENCPTEYLDLMPKITIGVGESLLEVPHVISINEKIFNSNPKTTNYLFGSLTEPSKVRYTGTYDTETGKVKIYRELASFYTSTSIDPTSGMFAGSAGYTWVRDSESTLSVTPFTPILISTKSQLPIIATALDIDNSTENYIVVPAIFFEYKKDKEVNDALKDAGVIVLDVASIALSGGAALSTKIHWAWRLYALAEMAGDASEILIKISDMDDDHPLAKTCNIYQGVVGIIGIKQSATGLISFAKGMKSFTINAIKNNESLKTIMVTAYLNFSIEFAKLKRSDDWVKFPEEIKDKLLKQQAFLKSLSQTAESFADDFFDIANIKALKDINPTGNQLNNIAKSKLTNYGKSSGGTIKTTIADIMKDGDRGGDLTEHVIREIMNAKGYEEVVATYRNGINGIDGMYIPKGQTLENATEVLIFESKQMKQGKLAEFDDIVGTNYDPASGLVLSPGNPDTRLPTQMTDDWIRFVFGKVRLENAKLGQDLLQKFENDRSLFFKYVSAIDKSTGDLYIGKISNRY